MTGPTCAWSVSELLLGPTRTPPWSASGRSRRNSPTGNVLECPRNLMRNWLQEVRKSPIYPPRGFFEKMEMPQGIENTGAGERN